MNNDLINGMEPKDVKLEITGSSKPNTSVDPVDGKGDFSVYAYLKEENGKCLITGRNTGVVGGYDFVALYKGPVPSNPEKYVAYYWVTKGWKLLTDFNWGSGYSAAYVAWNDKSKKYVYLAKTSETKRD